jgi:hypothetical protein
MMQEQHADRQSEIVLSQRQRERVNADKAHEAEEKIQG